MHTFKMVGKPPKARWVIQFDKSDPEATPRNLLWVTHKEDAMGIVSHLNGGPRPHLTVIGWREFSEDEGKIRPVEMED